MKRRTMPDLSGNDLGRYHIVEKLGEGGMALVYKAYDTRLERDVVVKFIRVDLIAAAYQGQMIKRFDREAKSLAKLSHPNILKIHDFGEYKGVPYLIMEYLPGGTLKALTGRPMPFKDAAALLAPIARALDYAHQENIIHCDIKPANILFSKTGIPILSNFGIAKINGIGEPAQLTDTFIAGTPEYIAPEQWENNISPKTDIYALGAVFYELVTGRTPYTADTPAAVLRKQLMDPLLSPAQFVPNLPEAVVKVINTALAKVPEERFVSMGEFAVALDNLAIQTDEVIEPSAIARGELASTPNVPGEKTQNTTLDKSIPILSQGEDASASLLIPKIVAKKRIPWGWIAAGVVSIVFATYLIVSSWGSNFGGLPQTELTRNSLKTSFAAQTTLASTAINSIAQFATSTTVALAPTPVPTILPPPKVKIKIGLSFPDISSVSVLLPRYHEESDLFHQMLEEKGYEVITSDAMGDPAQQNYQIDNMVSQGVKGLIIIAVDGDAVVSSVNKAADAGVKVMAYDRLINSPEISAYISFDYVSIGNNQAEGILTALNIDGGKWTKSNPAKVVILAGDPNDNKAILLHKGQMDVLQKYVDTGLIKIVDDQWIGNWSSGCLGICIFSKV